MKRVFIILTVMMLCLSGCTKKEEQLSENSSNTEEDEHKTIEVDERLIDVTITFPNSFFTTFDTTAEEYVDSFQKEDSRIKKVVLNEDQSVSMTISKADYKKMLSEMEENVNESLEKIIEDDSNSVIAIDHNKDFSVFDVRLSADELSFADSFLVLSFSMLGGFYQMFAGNKEIEVKVNFIGTDGTVINTWDSSELDN